MSPQRMAMPRGDSVFTRRDGSVRHFWSGEMGPATADPGQDPRGAPELDPLWAVLDITPEGRGKDWVSAPRLLNMASLRWNPRVITG
jgi:predicted dithiol-disulfide oxidoreductase (DUF899 family)